MHALVDVPANSSDEAGCEDAGVPIFDCSLKNIVVEPIDNRPDEKRKDRLMISLQITENRLPRDVGLEVFDEMVKRIMMHQMRKCRTCTKSWKRYLRAEQS